MTANALAVSENELLDILALMFDAYEEGPDCYEDPEDCSGWLGKAVQLDDEAFHRVADILNERRPRQTPNAKSQATDAALSRQVACTDGL